MTTESSDPADQLEHDAEEFDERLARVGEHIDESRDKLKDRQKAADDLQDTEDSEGGEASEEEGDPVDFDDPEALDAEEEE